MQWASPMAPLWGLAALPCTLMHCFQARLLSPVAYAELNKRFNVQRMLGDRCVRPFHPSLASNHCFGFFASDVVSLFDSKREANVKLTGRAVCPSTLLTTGRGRINPGRMTGDAKCIESNRFPFGLPQRVSHAGVPGFCRYRAVNGYARKDGMIETVLFFGPWHAEGLAYICKCFPKAPSFRFPE